MPPSIQVRNLLDSPPPEPGSERFDVLYERQGIVVQRITSSGSQPAADYCQPDDEWVVLLRGQARLVVGDDTVILREGDALCLGAQTPHRVVSTSENAIWLAVHIPLGDVDARKSQFPQP